MNELLSKEKDDRNENQESKKTGNGKKDRDATESPMETK